MSGSVDTVAGRPARVRIRKEASKAGHDMGNLKVHEDGAARSSCRLCGETLVVFDEETYGFPPNCNGAEKKKKKTRKSTSKRTKKSPSKPKVPTFSNVYAFQDQHDELQTLRSQFIEALAKNYDLDAEQSEFLLLALVQALRAPEARTTAPYALLMTEVTALVVSALHHKADSQS